VQELTLYGLADQHGCSTFLQNKPTNLTDSPGATFAFKLTDMGGHQEKKETITVPYMDKQDKSSCPVHSFNMPRVRISFFQVKKV